jgi:hypothetical protein
MSFPPLPPRPWYGGRRRTIPDRNCFAAIAYWSAHPRRGRQWPAADGRGDGGQRQRQHHVRGADGRRAGGAHPQRSTALPARHSPRGQGYAPGTAAPICDGVGSMPGSRAAGSSRRSGWAATAGGWSGPVVVELLQTAAGPLGHAYGLAEDVPELLRQVRSATRRSARTHCTSCASRSSTRAPGTGDRPRLVGGLWCG